MQSSGHANWTPHRRQASLRFSVFASIPASGFDIRLFHATFFVRRDSNSDSDKLGIVLILLASSRVQFMSEIVQGMLA